MTTGIPALRRLSPWLLRGAGLAACVFALHLADHRRDGSRASAIAADGAHGDARRVAVSAANAERLAAQQPYRYRIRSILNVPQKLTYGEFVWDDQGVPPGDVWIRVDLSAQILSVFRGGEEIGTAVIMYGGKGKPTPTGQFSVLWKQEDHRSSLYDAKMPYTLRLTGDGVAIHGADVRARYATNGCISVPIEFARLLFGQATVDTPVTILHAV
jgi:hypothetical protein